MTKVLVITNKNDITSDFIIKKLKDREIDFYRFNTEDISKSCFISLDFQLNRFVLKDTILQKEYKLKEFTSIYFRRPEIPTFDSNNLSVGEYSFIKNEFLYAFEGIYKILRDAYWVSPIYAIREAENKIYQLEIAQSIGLKIPNSIITNSFCDTLDFYDRNNASCIIKPIKSGLIEDNTGKSKVIFTNHLKNRPDSKEQIESAPNYFQSLIIKKYDVRVIVVGEKVFATLIHSQNYIETQVDWRRGENILQHTKFELFDDIKEKCVELLKVLNLRFGAIDFIIDTNEELVFLEINPNGQWAWIEKQTGYEISNEIVNLLKYENF
jgi:glutathione synthase/RimK-type ligase-like ATP-grasp enzyme